MIESANVRQLWWEGEDLHIITDDSQHTRYMGASVTSRRQEVAGQKVLAIHVDSQEWEVTESDEVKLEAQGLETLQAAMEQLTRLRDGLAAISIPRV